jgi:hypothetical protein
MSDQQFLCREQNVAALRRLGPGWGAFAFHSRRPIFRRMLRKLPAGFIAPCLPVKASTPPSGEAWLHEIKHELYSARKSKIGKRPGGHHAEPQKVARVNSSETGFRLAKDRPLDARIRRAALD